jgi:hypothetical protein
MQQILCHIILFRVLSADIEQLGLVLLIKQVQGLAFTSLAPAYQFCCLHSGQN